MYIIIYVFSTKLSNNARCPEATVVEFKIQSFNKKLHLKKTYKLQLELLINTILQLTTNYKRSTNSPSFCLSSCWCFQSCILRNRA